MHCAHCGHRLPQTLGERIQEARRNLGMTQFELDAAAHLGLGLVSKYESGVRTPRIGSLGRLAAVLGVGRGWLLDGDRA